MSADTKIKKLMDFVKAGYVAGDSLQEYQDTLARLAADANLEALDGGFHVFQGGNLGASEANIPTLVMPDNFEITEVHVVGSAPATGTATLDILNYDQSKAPPLTGRAVLASQFDLTTLVANVKQTPALHATLTNLQGNAGDVIGADFDSGAASTVVNASALIVWKRIDPPTLP